MAIEVESTLAPDGHYRPPSPVPVDPGVPLPPDGLGYRFKRKVLGPPLHSEEIEEQRLGKPTALAVFASDNLRGVKESGKVFAVPTYFFIFNMALLLGIGLWKYVGGDLPVVGLLAEEAKEIDLREGLFYGAGIWGVLHAFASGGAAVTGVEAISNGVPAFRKPAWKNARQTLVIMGIGLGIMFLGLSALAAQTKVGPSPTGTPTVIAQVGEAVFGGGTLGNIRFYSLQLGTMLILIMAANTGFADFPRLASFQAGDSFLPRQLMKRGHRLVYSNGVIVLAGVAMLLEIATGGVVTKLIPLYAIGVFTGFTISQAGMVKHLLTHRQRGYHRSIVIQGIGCGLSFVVLVILAVTKFTDGAWVILLVLPIMVVLLLRLNESSLCQESIWMPCLGARLRTLGARGVFEV